MFKDFPEDMRKSLEVGISEPDRAVLNPRHAFYGGRTNATRLFYEVSGDEKIQYVDFCSLYPYTNKYCSYPVGHPQVITDNFKDISEYYGLIKCTIIPPSNLYHPVLPYRAVGKLMFPLCRTCVETEQKIPCHHSDEERSLSGTYVSLELQKAVELGYVVQRIDCVWHFEQREQYDPVTKSGGLFSEYINTFLKIKQESSGIPQWCETEEDVQKYIRDYENKEGIMLDRKQLVKNPGLRALSKLTLNSFWGKFGQRINMSKTEVITDPCRLYEMLYSDELIVNNVNFFNAELAEVKFSSDEEFIAPNPRTNVVIAAFTTAHARLKLYSVLEQLQERVLYYDTDSVIYVERPV